MNSSDKSSPSIIDSIEDSTTTSSTVSTSASTSVSSAVGTGFPASPWPGITFLPSAAPLGSSVVVFFSLSFLPSPPSGAIIINLTVFIYIIYFLKERTNVSNILVAVASSIVLTTLFTFFSTSSWISSIACWALQLPEAMS